jgi:hypothetical protein
MPVSFSRSLFAASFTVFLSAGCSAVDAKTGAPQGTCGIAAPGGAQATPGGSYYPVGAAKTPAAPTCEGNTGSACNDCEGAHCCGTRSACYGDPVCACADQAFDTCLDAAAATSATEIAARTSQCWAKFSVAGTVEQARIACQRSWCKMECEVP